LDEEEAEVMAQDLGGRKGTEMRMEEEERKKEAEKEGEEQPATEPPPETGRPPSVTSRAGTPTIWDQFRILGDQYSRLVDIEGNLWKEEEVINLWKICCLLFIV
jgi:hypothetical protein